MLDFSRDPIRLRREKRIWIAACGTTLGADNGVGVAASLAILEAAGIKHGPLEILLTIKEESGQAGAKAISRGMLESRILVNLDSEEDEALYVGCAGSRDTEISLVPEMESKPAGYRAVKLQIRGLQGGHSGLNIHEGRANAIKLLSRFLWNVTFRIDIRLARFEGGGKLNAIPREAEVFVFVPSRRVSDLKERTAQYEKTYRDEFAPMDPGIVFEVGEPRFGVPEKIFSKEFQKRLLRLLLSLPHGVMTMSPALHGLVQTSTNLAALKIEGGENHHRDEAAKFRRVRADCLERRHPGLQSFGWRPSPTYGRESPLET